MQDLLEAQDQNWDLSSAIWEGGYYGYPDAAHQDKIFTPDFLYHQINDGTDIGSYYPDNFYVLSRMGCATWDLMPYDPLDHTTFPSENAFRGAPPYRNFSSSYYYISVSDDSDIITMKNVLLDNNLLILSMNADCMFEMTTLDNDNCTGTNHAQTSVGFDDDWSYT